MHDLEGMTIKALAELRDAVTAKLAERVAAKQKELAAEAERVGAFVAPAKKLGSAPKVRYKHPTKDLFWAGRGLEAEVG